MNSSNRSATSLLCLSLSSLPGSRDSFRPLSLSFLLCSTQLVAGGTLHTDKGLLIGLTATLFTWEPEVLDVLVSSPPFLPDDAWPLPVSLRAGLITGLIAELFELTGGGGLQSGGGMRVLGEHGWDFLPVEVMVAAGAGDKVEDVRGGS